MLTTGIVGLPMVGKTTLFNLLTMAGAQVSGFYSGKSDFNLGIARIPDIRIDRLSAMFEPKKTTYAQLEVRDVPGLIRGSSEGKGSGNKFLNDIRKVDALLQIVRAFRDDDLMHVDGSIDPLRDIDTLNMELILSDLEIVENRLKRLADQKKKLPDSDKEIDLLGGIKESLENERFANEAMITKEEFTLISGLGLLTAKPMLIVVNIDEGQLQSGEYPGKDNLIERFISRGVPLLEVCCKVEEELSQLSDEDRELLMEEYGIPESGIKRLARSLYEYLGLISFFTVGKDEVRAWTIERGLIAKRAAGKIHSDIERGFIKAEVARYEDLIEHGSMNALKERGLLRLEGKDYVVEDSDIISFRFNV